ncbi:MAG: hypothetical protein V3T86_09925 [Planctomycetota bacterium]
MVALLLALTVAAPGFETFDAPLRAERWYVGTPTTPKGGSLRLPKKGWIVSRGLPDDGIEGIEIEFELKGGSLEVSFFATQEPLTSPRGKPIVIQKLKGRRRLGIAPGGASLDGEPLAWKGKPTGTFRILAKRGNVVLHAVKVSPRFMPAEPFSDFERGTVHLTTTPQVYRDDGRDAGAYSREILSLWDVEVAVLFRRGPTGAINLAGDARGAPTLGSLVSVGDGRALSFKAAANPIAMRDWGDEKGNLSDEKFQQYVAGEYAVFELLQMTQRALNARVSNGKHVNQKALDALVHLAVIRHADNARAAVALAQTQKAKGALAALQKALGGDLDVRGLTGDKIRAAAGRAARAILKDPPEEWVGFTFDPQSRFLALSRAKDLTR